MKKIKCEGEREENTYESTVYIEPSVTYIYMYTSIHLFCLDFFNSFGTTEWLSVVTRILFSIYELVWCLLFLPTAIPKSETMVCYLPMAKDSPWSY